MSSHPPDSVGRISNPSEGGRIDNPPPDPDEQGTRLYVFVCMVSATAMTLVLMARNLGSGALLPGVVGFVLPLMRARSGAIIFLVTLLWVGLADSLGLGPFDLGVRILTVILSLVVHTPFPGLYRNPWSNLGTPNPVLDVLLCVAVVVYLASYHRLLGTTRYLFPLDRRRRGPSSGANRKGMPTLGPVLEQKRSGRLVEGRELGRLVLGVGLAVVLAQMLTVWLRERFSASDLWRLVPVGTQVRLPDPVWRLLILLWLFGVVLIVGHAVIGYLGHRRLSPEEAALYLQDQLWRQTRREQARLNRWLTWAERREAKRRARQERREKANQETHP